MSQIDVKPIVLRDCLLRATLSGSDSFDFEKHVSGVTITPTTSSVTWNGLSPDAAFQAPGVTTWADTLDYAQDWETENSLSMFLFEHEGEQVTLLFEPKKGGLGWETDVFIAPGSIGGKVATVAESSVTLGVIGRPRPKAPVVPPAGFVAGDDPATD
ncbi:hypothetical protein [Microbacterium sp. XT11]|uniref:hypothetical protein n=1 Tax=Microbacterium sp. XT11 TaxID=367477 RepID=UPI000831F5D1|nr:hypothetical protein [Microbacterium sp. XT11]